MTTSNNVLYILSELVSTMFALPQGVIGLIITYTYEDQLRDLTLWKEYGGYNVLSEITEQYVYRFTHQHQPGYMIDPLWGAQAGLQSYRYVSSACKSRNEMLPDARWSSLISHTNTLKNLRHLEI
jgi:hypothetical protein